MYSWAMRANEALSAYVLAGGRSSRMGTDKALLELQGKTLLERTLACAGEVASHVGIVGSAAQFGKYGPVVEDIFPDCGPLGGIHTALRTSTSDANLILAVDLPGLTPQFLRFLVAIAVKEPTAQAIVPRYDGRWQPLCAVYRREFAKAAETALQARRYRIDLLFAQVPAREISEAELESAGFNASIFRNVNTPADLEEARGGQTT